MIVVFLSNISFAYDVEALTAIFRDNQQGVSMQAIQAR